MFAGEGDPITFLGFSHISQFFVKRFFLCAFVTVTEAILGSYKAWEEENMFAMYLQNTRWVLLEVTQTISNLHFLGSHQCLYLSNQTSPSQLCVFAKVGFYYWYWRLGLISCCDCFQLFLAIILIWKLLCNVICALLWSSVYMYINFASDRIKLNVFNWVI